MSIEQSNNYNDILNNIKQIMNEEKNYNFYKNLREKHYIEDNREYLYECDYYFDPRFLCIKPTVNKIIHCNNTLLKPIDSNLYKIYIQDKDNENHYLVKFFKQKNIININDLNYDKIINDIDKNIKYKNIDFYYEKNYNTFDIDNLTYY